MAYTENGIGSELIAMGFTGKLLQDLQEIIIDDDTMEDFENFILLKGERMTKLLLVCKFQQHLQDKHSFSSCSEFVQAFESCTAENEKYTAITKLLTMSVTTKELNKVLEWIESDQIPVSKMYGLIVNYRKMYTTPEIITLIESLHA